MTFHFPDKYRQRTGPLGSTREECGDNGAGFIPQKSGPPLKFIASDGSDMPGEWKWEHVSVSLPHRCPTWEEMCRVKALFWDAEDAVMELHPPRSTWVNNHSYCLHLWRPVNATIPLPPEFMVGVRELGVLA